MASEDLLKKAVAAFNALSPEQQAEMLEEQRQSWVRGNVGLSRDERDMTSPMMSALKTVREENSIGRQAVKAWADSNTRPTPVARASPDATGKCGELVTLGFVHPTFVKERERGYDEIFRTVRVPENWEPVVTRSQAVELLAEERAEKEKAQASRLYWKGKHQKLEANNAALTARVNVQDQEISDQSDMIADQLKMIEALEAKLAAAEKALEPFVSFFNEAMKGFTEGYAERTPSDKPVLGWNNAYLLMQHFIEARAALGGKPS